MNPIIKYDKFKCAGKHKEKSQIILSHTSRKAENYINSLMYRNIKNKRIPHYIITKEGDILQLLEDNTYSNYFRNQEINKNSIIICLENLGWLEKVPLENYHINWIGDIYKGEVFDRKWRDYFLWDPYTEEQINSCSELCNSLTEKFSINKKCVGHNTKVDYVEHFRGIACRSNFDIEFTDLSPAFDFESFSKKICEHEPA